MDKSMTMMLIQLITYLHAQFSQQCCKIKGFCKFILNLPLNASQRVYNTIRKFQLTNSPRKEKVTYHPIRMGNVSYNGVFPFSLHREAVTKQNLAIAIFRQIGFDFVVTRPTKLLHLIFFLCWQYRK